MTRTIKAVELPAPPVRQEDAVAATVETAAVKEATELARQHLVFMDETGAEQVDEREALYRAERVRDARNALTVATQRSVLGLGELKVPHRVIAEATGVSSSTVSAWLSEAGIVYGRKKG